MKKEMKSKVTFWVRSLTWTLILYSMVMLFANWEDIKNNIKGSFVTISVNKDSIIQKVSAVNVAHPIIKSLLYFLHN